MKKWTNARRVQAGVVALLVGYSVMSYFDRTILSIAGPGIIKEFKLSETQMGSVYSAFIFSYALLMIPGGRWADVYGPRLVLTLVGLGAALFTGLTALGGRPGLGAYLGVVPAFILIRLGFGVSTAPLYPSCAKMSANWVARSRHAHVWGLIAAGAGIGSALTPPLCSWMIGGYGWRISCLLTAAATSALAVIWACFVRNHPIEHPLVGPEEGRSLVREAELGEEYRISSMPWRTLLKDRNLALLTFGYFTVNYFEYIFFYWIYYYLGQVRHINPSQSTLFTSMIFLAWTIMAPLGGWVSDRLAERYGRKLGRRSVAIVGLCLAALCLFYGTALTNPIATGTILALALGFAASSDGPYWSSAMEVCENDVGAAGGIMNTGGNLGGLIAPVLTPFIASRTSWAWGLNFGCFILLIGIGAWFLIDPTKTLGNSNRSGIKLEVASGPSGIL